MKKNHNPIILVIEIWPSIATVILKGIHAIPNEEGTKLTQSRKLSILEN